MAAALKTRDASWAEEHRTLRARLVQLGPDRLSDVVVDLPSETLAAWLAAPDAT